MTPPSVEKKNFIGLKGSTCHVVVARWSLERVSKLRNSFLVNRPHPPKNEKKISLS